VSEISNSIESKLEKTHEKEKTLSKIYSKSDTERYTTDTERYTTDTERYTTDT